MAVARLLCHFDGTNGFTGFYDVGGGHTLAATSVTVNTTAPKFGTGSGDFTATNAARIDTGNAADFNIGNQPFTIEAQAYFTSTTGLFALVSQWDSSANNGWWLGMNGGVLTFFYSTTGSDAPSLTASFSPTLNTWYHIAIERDASNVLRLYVNGVVRNSVTVTATFYASTRNCLIGNDYILTRGFTGHLDEVRVTIGLAQYGGAFTPPSAPFADTSPPVVTIFRSTQASVEEWTSSSTPALPSYFRATQASIEEWTGRATFTPYFLYVTQVSIEEWVSIAPPVVGPQARVQVMA
jgi:hypothetical protein